MNEEQNPYDESPYASFPYPQSHINRLATIATLFGLKPQAIDNCRVLELGCASGGNLIPMADARPGSRFVGIDFSSRQVQVGQEAAEKLGLKNIELRSESILDVTPDLGQFDYIICHGVWSWVPIEVREKILSICSTQLSPQGVAYVSYNTYPGWHMRGTIRDMMLYHSRKFATPQERVHHSRALLDFLVRSVPEEPSGYSILLKNEMKLLAGKSDTYLLHEHLEHVNEPMYFYQFQEQAAASGLQYLGEAELSAMLSEQFGAQVETILAQLSKNLVEREQYLDFLRNRTFRQTLLCHQGMPLNRRPDFERMRRLYISALVQVPAETQDVASRQEMKFTAAHGSVTTSEPGLKVALNLLSRKWPEAVRLEDLIAMVQAQIYAEPVIDTARRTRDAETLCAGLVNCYVKRFVEMYAAEPLAKLVPGEHPLGSRFARLQASTGNMVTNLDHLLIQLNDVGRHVLLMADGTRNREQLLNGLVELAGRQEIVVHNAQGTVTDPAVVRPILAESLERALDHLARSVVLTG